MPGTPKPKPTPTVPARTGYIRLHIGNGQYIYVTPDEHKTLMGMAQDPAGFAMGVRSILGYQPQSSGKPGASAQADDADFNQKVTQFNASRSAPVDVNAPIQSKDLSGPNATLADKQLQYAVVGPQGQPTGVDQYQQQYNNPASQYNKALGRGGDVTGPQWFAINPATGAGMAEPAPATDPNQPQPVQPVQYAYGVQRVTVPPGVAESTDLQGLGAGVDSITPGGMPYGAIGDAAGGLAKAAFKDKKAGSVASGALSGAGAGASIGASFGPIGAGVGAVVGGVTGGVVSKVKADKIDELNKQAKHVNDFADAQNSFIGQEADYIRPQNQNPYGSTLYGNLGTPVYAANGMQMGASTGTPGQYQLTADFQNSPSHAKGGTKYIAPVKTASGTYHKPIEVEGGELEITGRDGSKTIIPKNKAAKAKEFLKQGNDLALRTLISSLPKDGETAQPSAQELQVQGAQMPPQYAHGVQYLIPQKYADGGVLTPSDPALFGPIQPQPINPNQLTGNQPWMPQENMQSGQQNPYLYTTSDPALFMGGPEVSGQPNAAGGIGQLGEQAASATGRNGMDWNEFGHDVGSAVPTIYNLLSSMGKPKIYNPYQVKLDRYGYQDMSDVTRQGINQQANLAAEQTRNYAFNAAQAGANSRQAHLDAQRALNEVNLGEFGRYQNVKNANTDVTNQERTANLEEQKQAQYKTDMAKANQRQYLEAGLKGVGRLSDDFYTRGLMKSRDQRANQIQGAVAGTLPATYEYAYGQGGLAEQPYNYLMSILK